MVLGIGSDIIEVDRIHAAITRHGDRFLRRIFSQEEIRYCSIHRDAARHFAGRFAAKEAVVKALGIGFSLGISWLDVQVLNNEQGKPEVFCSAQLEQRCGGIDTLLLTISHCKQYATATAIWVK